VTEPVGVSAIVLAGGRSSRFGRDKLVEPVAGRPLLEHAIDGIRPLADEILVVVSPDATASIADRGIRHVHDATAFEGPLVGLVTGMAAAAGLRCLVVGGDMPTLSEPVLAALLAELDDPTIGVVLLERGDDVPPLPMAIRRSTLPTLQQATDRGERRLRAVRELLATKVVREPAWRILDPEGKTFADVDTVADLP
jgi:molybdopterin-guanine dinucleotide biosynthesis protein A